MAEAEELYSGILRDCPHQPDANHNIGIMAAQRGLPEAALPYLRTAVQAAPGVASYRISYIQALLDGGRTTAARRALRDGRRLGLGPSVDSLEALIAWAERRPPPVRAGDWFNLGVFHQQAGRPGSAAAAYRKAVLLHPENPLVLYWYGHALREQGWTGLAADRFRRALVLDPGCPEALFSLAALDDELGGYGRSLAVRPDYGDVHCNLGALANGSGRWPEAAVRFRATLALDPALAEALFNLATVHGSLDDSAAAVRLYRRTEAVRPDFARAYVNEALDLLRLGDYAAAWEKYEWRWRGGSPDLAPRPFAQPAWDGGPLDGKTILVHAEQGFGDTLQFCRYLPLVAAAAGGGGRLVLEVQAPLKGLFAGFPGVAPMVDQVVAQGDHLPAFSVHCPLLSLPRLFGTTPDSIPAAVPYLTANPARRRVWRRRLPVGRPQIGLCWAGNPGNRIDRQRSLPLERLLFLVDQRQAGWHVLQKELRPGDAELLAATPALVRHRLADFADTAALASALDLVITVDTAVAHLAGALGRPTWVLLSHFRDWHWFGDGDASAWYPTVRLFRQASPGDWGPVLGRVAEALRRWRP